ncbi:MAG: hypothetical protein GF355_15975 [Candidatus Eisenbacteria bacterium]|nr:hypothetical protein [Candidatus Eisenbacteria bacterium]
MTARIRSFSASLAVMAMLAAVVPVFGQGLGPPAGDIYAHDVLYRTVGTPTELPNNGPFDTIYVLGDGLANVSESAPGDMDYNGGRWEVRPITWVNIEPTQFTNAEQIEMAAENGDIEIGDVVKRFVCPLIRK